MDALHSSEVVATVQGVSKKFGESYKKTIKTKHTEQIFFIALHNSRHPLQHILTTFAHFRKQSANASCGIDRRTAVTRSLMAFTSAKRAPLMAAFKRGNRKKSAGARSGEQGGWSSSATSSEPGIGAQGSHCMQGHYRRTASIFQSCTTLVEPAWYAVAIGSNCLVNATLMVWSVETNSLWIMLLLSKKAIDSVLTLDFYRRLFFGREEVGVNTTLSIAVLIPDRTDSTRSFPVTMFSRSDGSCVCVCSNANPLHYYALRVPRKVDRWR